MRSFVKSEHEQSEHRMNGGRDGQSDGRRPEDSDSTLAVLCRSVAQLANAAPTPPRRIRLRTGQTTVEVEWPEPVGATPVAAGAAPGTSPAPAEPAEAGEDGLTYVKAPMVGTFYHAGSPDAPPFVKVGDLVSIGQPVGVLEAMKMMNTIEAQADGRVVELLASNAQPVEFDQRLIALEPAAELR
jgi:acetyl-CoA carboxylase biotin carboxyl carrier protein